MNIPEPMPVALVSGFLGAGKTTLMRRLILDAKSRGWKVAVVVNEYGAADIDSHILKEADAELIAAIAGGCACCSGQDDFHQTMQEIAARPTSERPDLTLVEASGLADPVLLLDVLTAAQLLPLLRVAVLVTVADAAHLSRGPDAFNPLMKRQAQLADLIVLNKTDLAALFDGPRAIEAAAKNVLAVNPSARLERAVNAEFDLNPLWQMIREPKPIQNRKSKIENEPVPHSAQTVICPLPHPVPREKLEAALEKLDENVWRAKGFVRLSGEAGLHLLQYTGGPSGGRFRFAPFYLPPGADEPATALVFIGPSLDRAALQTDFSGRGDWLPVI